MAGWFGFYRFGRIYGRAAIGLGLAVVSMIVQYALGRLADLIQFLS